MGGGIDIIVTQDKDQIFRVLGHPEIWPLISARKPQKNLIPTRPQDIYLMLRKGGEVIGCVYFEVLNGLELEMHPYILPEKRKGNSVNAVSSAMSWAFNQLINRILVIIPDDYPNVIAFAERLGFEEIGQNTFEMRSDKWVDL
jgi:RimJ/RimL family protein N-acetyltransferase